MRNPALLLAIVILVVCLEGRARAHNDEFVPPPADDVTTTAPTPCIGGAAGGFPCRNVHLLALLPQESIGAGFGNDMWGWTDPLTGREYAIMGFQDAVAFVDIGDPTRPVHLGNLPTETRSSIWNDLKVYRDHVYIVSEARGHGMQVFDLRQLRSVVAPPLTFTPTAHYDGFGSAHNIAINEETGFAYVVGSNTCFGGPHMIDLSQPAAPQFAGCDDSVGYTHDSQCVIYRGPDLAHRGKEICFHANLSPNRLVITDLSNRQNPRQLWLGSYPGASYTHQGWLTEDQAYFLLSDEEDEKNLGHDTRTYVWDVRNLDAPVLRGHYEAASTAIDHNLYVAGEHVFEANYRSGLRILRMGDLGRAELAEVGFFDTYPRNDFPDFSGAWSVYPFFESGVVAVSDSRGLFLLSPDLDAVAHCGDGIDNDADGAIDLVDSGCSNSSDSSELSACENALDDDGDALVDHPADPGCFGAQDDSEQSASLVCDDGLDNDADGHVDGADPDCSDPSDPSENACGDGVVEPGEQCDDGNALAGDCCSPLCAFEPPGRACDDGDACSATDLCDGAGSCEGVEPLVCDDGAFCNGVESCSPAVGCLAGESPAIDDGIACTVDRCDESEDHVDHDPDDAQCDDGNGCTASACDALLGCTHDAIPSCALLRVESAQGPDEAVFGEAVRVVADVGNLESGETTSGPVAVAFYLSLDDRIEPSLDVAVGECSIEGISMGASEACEDAAALVPAELNADSMTDTGLRYWGACARLDAKTAEPVCGLGNAVRVPEPASTSLGLAALALLALLRRRQRGRSSARMENAVTPTIDRPRGSGRAF